jgi:hypothetical protein
MTSQCMCCVVVVGSISVTSAARLIVTIIGEIMLIIILDYVLARSTVFDDYGLWQCFRVKGILCKMRFICHGSFLMGSPDAEAERFDDETQHPVTLTEGFWLGETAVTQQLWEAVMGNNPSHFKSDKAQLPVETVSWHDCQAFCLRINKLLPGLALTLPTEAQWEYACRAGTQTPFFTGQLLTTNQANYNGRDIIESRGKTVAVGFFPPMLGGCCRCMAMFGSGVRMLAKSMVHNWSLTLLVIACLGVFCGVAAGSVTSVAVGHLTGSIAGVTSQT